MRVLPIVWERDKQQLLRFDASFSTDRIYQVIADGFSFKIIEEQLTMPYYKKYAFTEIAENFKEADFAVAGMDETGLIVGFVTARYDRWNKSAVVSGIFVSPEGKGQGIGRTLLGAVLGYAKGTHARQLWLETQTVNYPAIQFYLRTGFQLCGLDLSLYDPAVMPDESALFFNRRI